MITSQTRTIDLADLDHLRSHLAKINKKIKSEGQGYVLIEGERGRREIKRESRTHIGSWDVVGYVETIDVEVRGVAPRIAGWTFVGTLTWDHGECVINAIPGLPEVGDARPKVEICDHCGSRRYRKATYLLRSESGEYQQVGSTCLKDFLGHSVNLALVGINVFEGCDSQNRYEPEQLSVTAVLVDTLRAYRAWGWTSATAARESGKASTRTLVENTLWGSHKAAKELREELAQAARADDETWAQRVIDWARGDEVGSSDYALNLKAALSADTFRSDHLGLVVSAPASYKRWYERQAAQGAAARDTRPESVHIGTVKERLRALKLTVTGTRYIEGEWGVTTLVLLRDADGNAFKWFASNAPFVTPQPGVSRDLEVNDRLVLDGTVKAHEVYNGLKSTVLTRCKVLEIVPSQQLAGVGA